MSTVTDTMEPAEKRRKYDAQLPECDFWPSLPSYPQPRASPPHQRSKSALAWATPTMEGPSMIFSFHVHLPLDTPTRPSAVRELVPA